MKPIYEPKGAAKEYGDLALNIYTGCPHRCFYCYAPNVLHKDRAEFHLCVEPRKNIVEETKKQIEREKITDKLVHLCFTCDPYPTGYDSTPTKEIIKVLKDSGNHIQILTKGDGSRDLDLLDENDWYGITLDGTQDGKAIRDRVNALIKAHEKGIRTWVSFEPVTDELRFFAELTLVAGIVDKVKIGKLNYHKSDINWADFGRKAEAQCVKLGLNYYIKDSLRAEMNKDVPPALSGIHFFMDDKNGKTLGYDDFVEYALKDGLHEVSWREWFADDMAWRMSTFKEYSNEHEALLGTCKLMRLTPSETEEVVKEYFKKS